MKKLLKVCLLAAMCFVPFACSNNTDGGNEGNEDPTPTSAPISVITREEGSGTRGAFTELFGIIDENKVDMISDSAEVTNSTSVMITTVAGNKNAIGYISLGSLNNDVKAVKIDGAEATVDNINNGSYKISRPFNIAVKEDLSEVAQDFINFILSDEGQAVVEKGGCIKVESTGAYTPANVEGKVLIGGSSSVTPVMEKLKEAYEKVNTKAKIEIQTNDSTTGVTSAIDGVCDIGMASRELKDTESSQGIKPTVIALDGIAVIVNNNSTVDELTSEQVKSIYTGEVFSWDEVVK